MKKTRFVNTLYMHPQERNIHGKIFGGYLMKEAFELAWIGMYMYTHSHIQNRYSLLIYDTILVYIIYVYIIDVENIWRLSYERSFRISLDRNVISYLYVFYYYSCCVRTKRVSTKAVSQPAILLPVSYYLILSYSSLYVFYYYFFSNSLG
jgi:hypothetical protein